MLFTEQVMMELYDAYPAVLVILCSLRQIATALRSQL